MRVPETDPMQAASEKFNRRVFVGISAAAGLVVSAAPLTAQESDEPPPLIPEDDPAIVVDHIELERPGVTVSAYAAWPKGAVASTPSVVVIMHVWGVDTSIRDVVRRFAKAGFAAIAPDLYARWHAPSGDGVTDSDIFRPYARKLEAAQYVGDISAAADWLRAKFSGTKTGITGFCMGGHLVLVAVVETGTLFAAACPFYGYVEGIDPKAIHIPICGNYGARDSSIPADSVRKFAAALTVANDVRIYDNAGHAFFDSTRPRYVASAAEDAWRRTIAFFTKYLGGTKT